MSFNQNALTAVVIAGLAISIGNDESAYGQFDCGYQPPEFWVNAVRQAVARGEISDPARRRLLPIVEPRQESAGCLAPVQIYPFEDTNGVLLTNFSGGQLSDLMADAANEVMATYGDNFDFVGYWLNFVPDHVIGAAFYSGLENDVTGIGLSTFNGRASLGVAGENIEGFVMMWNINNPSWQPGTGGSANFTRLVLGQEFEHRFAMFLPDLLDGRVLQGQDNSCGRSAHWNWKVDGQESSMEISEWVGSNPASRAGSFGFNTDIPGSVFSYFDLYLMGYVSPSEMDAGMSELRYMNNSASCGSSYFGTITSFSSADVIAAAGPRVPDSTTSQQDFRTAWVMIHLPGDPPSQGELDKAVAILEQHMIDWNVSTLGRGTMNNALDTDCNCNGLPDLDDLIAGTSSDCNGNGVLDECDIADGTSVDVDGDGIPDECNGACCINDSCSDQWTAEGCLSAGGLLGTSCAADCNGNGIADACDIAAGTSGDCNANGIPDGCDIADGTSQDCNGNSVPDGCEFVDCNGNGVLDECDIIDLFSEDCNNNLVPDECDVALFKATSDELSPLGQPFIHEFVVVSPPPASGDVVLSSTAIGDLIEDTDQVFVSISQVSVGVMYGTGANHCPLQPDTAQLIVTAETYNNLVQGQDAVIGMQPSGTIDPAACNGMSYISMSIEYPTPPGALDCNLNGRPDSCDIADGTSEDDNGNGTPDECEAPSNDSCSDAGVVTNGAFPFNTLGATTDGFPLLCEGQNVSFQNDVWFTYVATCSGTTTFSTCNDADFDSIVAVYFPGACPANALIACNDNAATCGLTSSIELELFEGIPYFIRIGGVNGSAGTGTLTISCGAPCPWDCDGNNDDIVSVTDLLALLAQYDPESPLNCTGGSCDFDASGCVDVVDLLKLLAHYDPAGVGCP